MFLRPRAPWLGQAILIILQCLERVPMPMLEVLLQRIAHKGATSLAPDSPNLDPTVLRAADGQHSGYPAAANHTSELQDTTTADPIAAAQASAAWTRAKLAYQHASAKGKLVHTNANCFANYGMTHQAVAALLWSQRRNFNEGAISICSNQGVVAYVVPQDKRVLLRQSVATAELAELVWAPAPHHTKKLSGLGKEYASTSINMLLWFYGQTCTAATDLLSHKLVQQPLHLRKLPTVEAKALELRHLTLIQCLSAGAFYFDRLQHAVAAPQAPWLCADLASLYLVGALSAAPGLAVHGG